MEPVDNEVGWVTYVVIGSKKLAIRFLKEMRRNMANLLATVRGGQMVYDSLALYFYCLQKDDYSDKKT